MTVRKIRAVELPTGMRITFGCVPPASPTRSDEPDPEAEAPEPRQPSDVPTPPAPYPR